MLVSRTKRATRQPGMTLIELGLVIGVFGFIMIFVADFFQTGVLAVTAPQAEDNRRLTVRHVDMILEAARRYHNQYDNWPTNAEGQIHIDGLSPDFLNLEEVRNLYSGCGDESNSSSCTPYTLKGIQRLASTLHSAQETTDPAKADDLIVEFGFPGDVYSRSMVENQNHPAVVLAKLLPLGVVKSGASGNNETLIEARIHRILSRPYLLLDGETRVVTFEEGGELKEVALLTYNNENLAHAWQVTGPAISLMPVGDRANIDTHATALDRINAGDLPENEVFIGTNEVTRASSAYLRMRRFDPPCRPDTPCYSTTTPSPRAQATFGVRTSNNYHHQMALNAPFQGSLGLWILPNTRPSRPGVTTPLRMDLVPANFATNVEAHWDILLSDDSRHRSLQTRLCALEGQYSGIAGVKVDCSCPGIGRLCRAGP